EERYRLIISSILNAIGFRTEVEHILSTGRIDILCDTPRYIYVIELKLTKNGGLVAAEKQIMNNQNLEPFKTDKKRKVVGLAIELDDMGKGLLEWKKVE
ncbi:MAG: PD-(D/E)XK nuclease domain-containing protein, partial [Prevotella sp.]|nr:PD-(D/E)XK nuclease domain-containing protein [Prevotella sp.]